MIEFISQLPTEYQEVEYIQSSGTQYIDTGVVATSGFEIDIKINIDTVTGSWAPILSAHELSAPYKRNFMAYTSSKKMEIDAGDKITQTSVTLTGDDVIKASNVENNFYLNINGTNYTPTVTTAASNLAYSGRTMHLLHSNGYDFGYTSGKVYYCKITVDGTLVRNFVPCYRKSDNIVGLYDLINGAFYTNAGTGNFAKGKNSNSHSDAVITPGGVIPMQYALRRRMMMAVLGIDVAALSINYTGAYTDYGMVTMSDGARYRLLAFTSSGTLSIEQPVNCEVCVVGGGANGTKAANSGPSAGAGNGGAGAYLKNQAVSAYNGGSVVVGAGQGVSSIADVSVNAVSGKSGGTGAGGKTGGTGDGISKYPFEDTGYSLWAGKPHCAGGGQGAQGDSTQGISGGNGGTNGGNGYSRPGNWVSNPSGGAGGSYGGGAGGINFRAGDGGNATYYGSGAGGGANYINDYGSTTLGNGGSGYQGIVYMRIPGEPPAYISDLPLGALINVGTDGGAGASNYEIADKNNLVSGGVVLVRKNIYSKSAFGSNSNYPNGTLDNLIKTTIYNKMPQQLRDKMMDVTFNLSGSGNITRKMFALTYTMMGFGNNNGVAEGKALQLYTSNTSRIKTFDGSAYAWWLSSKKPSNGGLWLVNASGGAYSDNSLSRARGVVPAFVIPSETPYDPTPNTDGSYNLIL